MAEEPCQCSDCQRFYKEHDRLIREFPTFKQQQELNWASIQSFRTLCTKMTDELQRELSERELNKDINQDDLILLIDKINFVRNFDLINELITLPHFNDNKDFVSQLANKIKTTDFSYLSNVSKENIE